MTPEEFRKAVDEKEIELINTIEDYEQWRVHDQAFTRVTRMMNRQFYKKPPVVLFAPQEAAVLVEDSVVAIPEEEPVDQEFDDLITRINQEISMEAEVKAVTKKRGKRRIK